MCVPHSTTQSVKRLARRAPKAFFPNSALFEKPTRNSQASVPRVSMPLVPGGMPYPTNVSL